MKKRGKKRNASLISKEESDVSFFPDLPHEIRFYIFTFLGVQDVINCSKVCKEWRQLTNSKMLWSTFVKVKTGKPPRARLCNMSFIYENKFYVIGGHTPTHENHVDNILGDASTLDLVGHNAFKRWKPQKILGDKFPTLTESNGVIYNGNWVFFGGLTSEFGWISLNRVYFLDLSNWNLEMVKVTSEYPAGRSVHSLVLYEDALYIFGGWNNEVRFSDFWKFDLKTRKFVKLTNVIDEPGPPPKKLPPTRYPCAAVYKDRMIMTTGYLSKGRHLTSVYQYHFGTGRWEEINTKGKTPSPRSRSRCFVYGDYYYIVGGCNMDSKVVYGDMFKLNLETWEWTEVKMDMVPQTSQHSIAIHERGTEDGANVLYVYGGYNNGKATNNLWGLRLFK